MLPAEPLEALESVPEPEPDGTADPLAALDPLPELPLLEDDLLPLEALDEFLLLELVDLLPEAVELVLPLAALDDPLLVALDLAFELDALFKLPVPEPDPAEAALDPVAVPLLLLPLAAVLVLEDEVLELLLLEPVLFEEPVEVLLVLFFVNEALELFSGFDKLPLLFLLGFEVDESVLPLLLPLLAPLPTAPLARPLPLEALPLDTSAEPD